MIVLVISLCLLHAYLFYIRKVMFFSKKYGNIMTPYLNEYRSPVEGRCMYVNLVRKGSPCVLRKDGRIIYLPFYIPYDVWQIGIYMSPYNNHHVMTMNRPCMYLSERYKGKLNTMLDWLDMIFPFTAFRDWLIRKAGRFICVNESIMFKFPDYRMVMIFDKYVSKFKYYDNEISNGREVLGLVHRGSQMDVLLAFNDFDIAVNEGDRVQFDTLIGRKR